MQHTIELIDEKIKKIDNHVSYTEESIGQLCGDLQRALVERQTTYALRQQLAHERTVLINLSAKGTQDMSLSEPVHG